MLSIDDSDTWRGIVADVGLMKGNGFYRNLFMIMS
jgi:hypothetical protein